MAMKISALIALTLVMAACSQNPDEVSPRVAKNTSDGPRTAWAMPSEGRFKLERVQDFQDNAAYNGYRSVYVLTDTETGKEFIGISGIGISEVGSHRSGKTSTTDER